MPHPPSVNAAFTIRNYVISAAQTVSPYIWKRRPRPPGMAIADEKE